MIIVPKLRLGYQNVPKVATTSVFEWLYWCSEGRQAQGVGRRGNKDKARAHFQRGGGAIKLENRPDDVRPYEGFYRFALTRDPIKRFLSMYSNRVVHYRELSEASRSAGALREAGLGFDPQVNELVSELEAYTDCSKVIRHHALPMMDFLGPDLEVYSRIVDISESGVVIDELRRFWEQEGLSDILARCPAQLERRQTGGPKVSLSALDPNAFERLLDVYRQDYDAIPTVSVEAIKEEYARTRAVAPGVELIDFPPLESDDAAEPRGRGKSPRKPDAGSGNKMKQQKSRKKMSVARELIKTDPAQAKVILLEVLDRNPANNAALALLTRAECKTGEWDAVCALVERAVASGTEQPQWLGRIKAFCQQEAIELADVRVGIDLELVSPSIALSMAMDKYEKQEAGILRQVLEADDRVLELGAGVGYLGLVAKHLHQDVAYLALEANPRLIPLIRANQRLNGTEFDAVNKVVHSTMKSCEFHIDRNFWASSLLDTSQTKDTVSVECVTFEEARAINDANFLIVDIEGGEEELFSDIPLAGIDKVLIELHPRAIGDEACSAIVKQLLNEGFTMGASLTAANVYYFYR